MQAPKAKKKSKEEIEAKRREQEAEEERLRQEELARQEAERQRQEAERKRLQAEAEQRRREELAALAAEFAEDAPEVERAGQVSAAREAERRKQLMWNKYLECSSRPDPLSDADLNTYLTETKEKPVTDLAEALQRTKLTEQVCQDLEGIIDLAIQEADNAQLTKYSDFRKSLRDVTFAVIDRATAHDLQAVWTNATGEDAESRTGYNVNCAKVGLWVSLSSKGGRMRSIQFSELGIVLDIPKALVSAGEGVGFRVMHLAYDDIRERAKAAHALEKTFAAYDAMEAVTTQKTTTTARAGRRGSRLAGKPSKKDEAEETKGTDQPAAPVAVAAAAPATPAAPYCKDITLGGIVIVERLQLPPQPKQVKNWMLHHYTPLTDAIRRLPHPLAGQAAASTQAVKVKYTIPPNVIIRHESPRIAYWDVDADAWNEEGIMETSFDPLTRTAGCHTVHLTAHAIVQARTVDLPYSNWSIVPKGRDVVVFNVWTPRFQVSIDIRDSGCRLLGPDIPELADVRAERLGPGALLHRLVECGIMLQPTDEDAKHMDRDDVVVRPTPKVKAIEDHLYDNIADLCAAFSIRHSRWNQGVDAERAVILVKETMDPDEDPADVHETDWRCAHFMTDPETNDGVKCVLVQATEGAAAFNPTPCEMEKTHRSLRRTVTQRSTPEALEVAGEASPLVKRAVAQLFKLVRPASFC